MKALKEIYDSLYSFFKKRTNLDIAKGSVLDSYFLASAEGIHEAYDEIEKNKNPHIFTNLKGKDIDSMGILVGCARRNNESDSNYLYRMINWNTNNQCANASAIEAALQNMTYVSNATHIPFTQGVGTGTIYIIPKKMDEETKNNAIKETKDRLKDVIGAENYIEYVIPKILFVDINVFVSIATGDDNVKQNIISKFISYINNIAPGDYLDIGELNKIGVNEPNVEYFSVSSVFLNNKEVQNLKVIQKLDSKMVFNSVNWNKVVNE